MHPLERCGMVCLSVSARHSELETQWTVLLGAIIAAKGHKGYLSINHLRQWHVECILKQRSHPLQQCYSLVVQLSTHGAYSRADGTSHPPRFAGSRADGINVW